MAEVNAHRHVVQMTFLSADGNGPITTAYSSMIFICFFKQAAGAASRLCQIPVFQMNLFKLSRF